MRLINIKTRRQKSGIERLHTKLELESMQSSINFQSRFHTAPCYYYINLTKSTKDTNDRRNDSIYFN